MRRPGPGVILVGGLALFGLAAVAVIGWAYSGRGAGEERGLVFKNFGNETLVLTINDHDVALQPNQQQTVPVRASQFPQTLRVRSEDGQTQYQRDFQFSEFQGYQFYVGLQDDGFATYTDPTLR